MPQCFADDFERYIHCHVVEPFIHLTISFDRDYLLIVVQNASYVEIRFQVKNIFLYSLKTNSEVNDFTFVQQGGLTSKDFPLVILTVGMSTHVEVRN